MVPREVVGCKGRMPLELELHFSGPFRKMPQEGLVVPGEHILVQAVEGYQEESLAPASEED